MMSDVDNGGGYACVGTGGYMGNLCRKFTSQFCCKPILLQKNEKKKKPGRWLPQITILF